MKNRWEKHPISTMFILKHMLNSERILKFSLKKLSDWFCNFPNSFLASSFPCCRSVSLLSCYPSSVHISFLLWDTDLPHLCRDLVTISSSSLLQRVLTQHLHFLKLQMCSGPCCEGYLRACRTVPAFYSIPFLLICNQIGKSIKVLEPEQSNLLLT